MSFIIRYVVRGALVAAPIGATVYIVFWIVRGVDRLAGVTLPGLGLLLTLGALGLVGFLVSNVLGAQLVRLVEGTLVRLPLVRMLYSALRDLVGAFVGDKRSFDRPVVVSLPGQPFLLLGFLTREDLAHEALQGYRAVYLPQSYNFAGNLILVPESAVRPIDAPSAEMMTFIMSGGVSGKLNPR